MNLGFTSYSTTIPVQMETLALRVDKAGCFISLGNFVLRAAQHNHVTAQYTLIEGYLSGKVITATAYFWLAGTVQSKGMQRPNTG